VYLFTVVREQLEEQLRQHGSNSTRGFVAAEFGMTRVVDVSSFLHDKLALRHKPNRFMGTFLLYVNGYPSEYTIARFPLREPSLCTLHIFTKCCHQAYIRALLVICPEALTEWYTNPQTAPHHICRLSQLQPLRLPAQPPPGWGPLPPLPTPPDGHPSRSSSIAWRYSNS
jgi:hypothetical protein